MNLLSSIVLVSVSIFIIPVLIGCTYIILTKNLPEDEFDISYEEF